jgi:hypothetical protein
MKNKTIKIISKTILLFPIGFATWFLANGFDINNWIFGIATGLVISFGIVFWNLFDYEKYNEMNMTDFLESKHNVTLENNIENWNKIEELIKNPFAKLKVLEKTDSSIRIQIDRKILDSILTIKKTPKSILLGIESKYLSYLPDKAKNYQTLQKLVNRLQTTANIGSSQITG